MIDFGKINWELSNVELMHDYGWSSEFTAAARRQFGRPKNGTLKTRSRIWKDLDWEHKNDQQLCVETGYDISIVRRHRFLLGLPPSPGRYPLKKTIELDNKVAEVDWVNTRDVEVARKWNVSRERVRQIRLVRQLPICTKRRLHPTSAAIMKWLEANREKIEGLPLMKMFRMCPIVCNKPLFSRVVELTDIGVGAPDYGKKHAIPDVQRYPINWQLPVSILCRVWNLRYYILACERSRFKHPAPLWKMQGFGAARLFQNPVFQQAITNEIRKAVETIGFDGTSVIEEYLSRKQAYYDLCKNYPTRSGDTGWTPIKNGS
jgi:hypothetical protein